MVLAVINPVAFTLGPIQIYWYGIILGTSALLGLWIAIREGKRHQVASEIFLDLVVWVLPAAIVGARLYYVGFQWDYYVHHMGDIFAVWNGGLAIHGGLIGAFLAGALFVRKYRLSFLKLADIIAPSILLGQALGRWGNFINQEAHGGIVSRALLESLHLPDWIIGQMEIQGVYYQPTFLYESMWDGIGFFLLLLLRKINLRRGEIFFTYMIWYSLGRFFIEGLRTDSLSFVGPKWLSAMLNALWLPLGEWLQPGSLEHGNIRVAQLVSLLGVLIGLAMILWRRLSRRAWAPYRSAIETNEA
jgi:phosphatidylglycerol:prolipoprotein diacylglycerol transferase